MSDWLRGRSRADRALAAITLLGLVLRVGYVLLHRDLPVEGDGEGYYWSGRFLADGHGFVSSSAFRMHHDATLSAAADHPPGWILVFGALALLGVQRILWFQLVAAVIGTATVAAVGVAGRRIAGPRVGLLAAGIAAVYPNLWMYERVLLCETPAILLAALTIGATYRFREHPTTRGAAVLGLLVGLLTMVRPEALLVGVLAAPVIWLLRDVPARRRLQWTAVAGAVAVAPIVPWAAYNTARFEAPVVLTTNLGHTIVSSNCDAAYYDGEIGWWDYGCLEDATRGAPADAAVRDRELQSMAFDYMRSHTRRFVTVVLAREGRTFGLYKPFEQVRLESLGGPTEGVLRAGLLAYWPLALLAVAGVVVLRRRRVPVAPLVGFVGTVAIAAGLTIGQIRYRALAEVPIVLLAAVAVDALATPLRHPAGPAPTAGATPGGDDGHRDAADGRPTGARRAIPASYAPALSASGMV
ncbi:MAG TPA: glycosyltransferase family 39 protein, partial [Acidimicrobiales bacterium]